MMLATFYCLLIRLKLLKAKLSDEFVKRTSLNYVHTVPVQHTTPKSLRALVKLCFAFKMLIFAVANDRSAGADMIKTYSSKRC